MEELTSVLTAVLRGIQQQPQQAAAAPVVPAPSAPINIPAFDPSKSDAGAMGWCDDMETTFKWTDFEQLCRAAGALEGDAKDWYGNWHPSNKVWASFRAELCQLYPAKRNLSERLRKAKYRRNKPYLQEQQNAVEYDNVSEVSGNSSKSHAPISGECSESRVAVSGECSELHATVDSTSTEAVGTLTDLPSLERKSMETFDKKIKIIYAEKKKFLAPFSATLLTYKDVFKTMAVKETIRSVATQLRGEILNSNKRELPENCTAEDLMIGECDNVLELFTCYLESLIWGDVSHISKKSW
ncbi:unnamed protein product [Acanthoscelides obtectus]|uniref:Uncharacterized protein n=1 Tax=Acanthoscelides obtectus TaxID=200917 RepID=A0A9P0MKC4_ACAOB|nr:unnamed protein product [Acanthoscelides obtectus]CAK1682300.1 hypothetical protein AOBTE_LOCUS33546 [Acanthoscelides obtectus]